MSFKIIPGYERIEDIQALFTEYTDMLVETVPGFEEYLALQNCAAELDDPTKKYALPDGRLFLALVDGEPVGCSVIRKLDAGRCELKRMYVRPEFRGRHLSRALLSVCVEAARDIGYKYVMLDTEPQLAAAIALYESSGFERVERYSDSPFDSTIYYRLAL